MFCAADAEVGVTDATAAGVLTVWAAVVSGMINRRARGAAVAVSRGAEPACTASVFTLATVEFAAGAFTGLAMVLAVESRRTCFAAGVRSAVWAVRGCAGLCDGEVPTECLEESGDSESAAAIAHPANATVPTPRATARPPTRPIQLEGSHEALIG
ncbi:hypothetical protein GCM10010533_25490 [Mycolicibacterium pallens]